MFTSQVCPITFHRLISGYTKVTFEIKAMRIERYDRTFRAVAGWWRGVGGGSAPALAQSSTGLIVIRLFSFCPMIDMSVHQNVMRGES